MHSFHKNNFYLCDARTAKIIYYILYNIKCILFTKTIFTYVMQEQFESKLPNFNVMMFFFCYYLVVPSTDIFTIDSTGEIMASGKLDRENISSYAVVVKVRGLHLFSVLLRVLS